MKEISYIAKEVIMVGQRCYSLANCEASVDCEKMGDLGPVIGIDTLKMLCSNRPGCNAISCEGPDDYEDCVNYWMFSTSCDESTMEDDANWSIYLSNPGRFI